MIRAPLLRNSISFEAAARSPFSLHQLTTSPLKNITKQQLCNALNI